jgi:glycosyltransferase involved in cell wall biosynthesis
MISGAFPPSNSGEAQHALLLARQLAARGFEVDVLASAGSVTDHMVHVHPLMRGWSWSDLPTLGRFLRSSAPDVVLLMYIGWIYDDHAMITYAPTVARLAKPGVRFVTQFENVLGALPARYGRMGQAAAVGARAAAGLWRTSYRFGTLVRDSTRLIVLSEHHRDALGSRLRAPSAKMVLVPPPPLLATAPESPDVRRRGRAMLNVGEEDFLLVYLGYLYPQKRVETLLKAFALVSERRVQAKLAIVGGVLEGYEDYAARLRDLPAELGIDHNVRWAGPFAWDSTDGSTMLRAADAFAMPINAGVALNNSSIGAAASHGLPLVATRPARLESAFREGENILLCAPDDPPALAAAIEAIVDDDRLRRRLSAGARALADEWFSWPAAVEKTIATFGD